MLKVVLLLMMIATQLNASSTEISPELLKFGKNKHIPKIIERSVLIALSHYPQLEHTSIKFVFKKNIHGSVMQAQPIPTSLI